ncbi:MAG: Npun_F0494 family protein [Cyanobacteria bacterium J06598_3]
MDIPQSTDNAALPVSAGAVSSTTMQYSSKAIHRAERAVRCSPFYPKLLAEMRVESVGILTIAEDSGMLKGYTHQPLSEPGAETELLWLSSVGILRREVDGQGLTDSFRLTPLGRQVVERWQSQGCPDRRASLVDYIKNAASRRLRIPDWLV